MVDCVTYRPLIGSREGELAAAEASALASHLAGCAACRRWAADLAATEGIVSEALLAAAAARDFGPFVDQVMARVEAERPAPLLERLKRAVRLHPRLVIGGALAPLLAAVAVAIYLGAGAGQSVADNRGLELTTEGSATTVIQSSDGPLVLLDDDDEAT